MGKKKLPPTVAVIQGYILTAFDVAYEESTVRKLLKKHNIKFMKSRLKPGNQPNVSTQLGFVDEYQRTLKKSLKDPGFVHLFGDGMHLVHQVTTAYYWGSPLCPYVLPTNTSRNKLNIIGAYNPVTQELVHLSSEANCDSNQVIEFLKKINESYQHCHTVILYLDNARYFYAKIVRDWISAQNRIQIIYLPPYSPNLNLIERLWRFVKRKLTANKYYEKYPQFRAKAFQLLNHIGDFADELKSLINNKFEIIRH